VDAGPSEQPPVICKAQREFAEEQKLARASDEGMSM
jgi:hypothetical protein